MKRLFPAVPALLLCLTLAACAAPTPTPIPALEPPLSDSTKAQPVPDFLDTDQQALFLHAFEAANFLMGCETSYVDRFPFDDGSMPDLDHCQTVELGGDLYVISVGRYARWADFKAMMDALFTSEYQEELLYFTRAHGTPQPLFTSTEDGRLCYLDASRGSSLGVRLVRDTRLLPVGASDRGRNRVRPDRPLRRPGGGAGGRGGTFDRYR